jgi:hypothetical protein
MENITIKMRSKIPKPTLTPMAIPIMIMLVIIVQDFI